MLEEESHKHSFYFFLSFLFFLIIFPSNVFSIYDQVIYDGWVLSGSYLNLSNEQYRVIYVKNTNSTVVYFPGGISAVISPTNKSCSKEWIYSVCQTNQKFERAGYDVLPTVNDPNINVSLYLQINSSNVSLSIEKNISNILYVGDSIEIETIIKKKGSNSLYEISNISFVDLFSSDFDIFIVKGCNLRNEKLVFASEKISNIHKCVFKISPKKSLNFTNNITLKYDLFGKEEIIQKSYNIEVLDLPFTIKKSIEKTKKIGEVFQGNISIKALNNFIVKNISFDLPGSVKLINSTFEVNNLELDNSKIYQFTFNNTKTGNLSINYSVLYTYSNKDFIYDSTFLIKSIEIPFMIQLLNRENISILRLNNPTENSFSNILIISNNDSFELDHLGPNKFHEFETYLKNITKINYSYNTIYGEKINRYLDLVAKKEENSPVVSFKKNKFNLDIKINFDILIYIGVGILGALIIFKLSTFFKSKKSKLDKEIEKIRKKKL